MSEPYIKLSNYTNALSRLNEGIAKYDEANDLLRDGVIQKFELTLSLLGKFNGSL